jgi:hypothetical protein
LGGFTPVSDYSAGAVYLFLPAFVAVIAFFDKKSSTSGSAEGYFLVAGVYRHAMLAFGLYGAALCPYRPEYSITSPVHVSYSLFH